MEKLAGFNMQTLPNILYHFKTLPILLLHSNALHWEKKLRSYLWQHKKPRVALSSLVKHREQGGIGLPDLLAYYRATLLDQIKFWFTPTSDKSWVSIQQAIIAGHDFSAIAIVSLLSPTFHKLSYPTMVATLEVWWVLLDMSTPMEDSLTVNNLLRAYEWVISHFYVKDWIVRDYHFVDSLPESSLIQNRFWLSQIQHFHSSEKCKKTVIPGLFDIFYMTKESVVWKAYPFSSY